MVSTSPRVIGEAAVRLTIEGTGLGAALKRQFAIAAKEASAGGGLFPDIDKQADESTKKVEARFKGMFGRLQNFGKSFASGFGSVLAGGASLVALGAKAGVALAGITSLAQGVIGLVGVLQNASGAAALLPAALAGVVAVAATVKIGLSGVGDAFKALASGDTAKLNEALKKLAPSAQEFVRSAQAIKPAFDDMKLSVQQALFQNLGGTLRDIGARFLPVLKTGFTGIAAELNTAAVGIGRFLTDARTTGQVGSIFDNIRKSVAALAPSFTSILDALLNITDVGSTFLPGLANSFSKVTDNFAQFIQKSKDSGALSDFIQTAIDTIKQLGTVIKNVFGILGDVINAANISGGGLLNNLISITDEIHKFTSSAEGSQAINTFFVSMSKVIAAVLPIVLNLAGIFATQLAPALANIVTTLAPVVNQFLGALGEALKAAIPGIQALVQGFADLIAGLQPALPAIGQLAAVLGNGLGQVLTALAPVIGQLVTALATTLAQAIPPLIPIITQLVTIIGQILTAVAPLIAPLVQLATAALGPILTIVAALIPPFQQLIDSVLKALQPLIPVISQAFTELGTALAPLAGALGSAVVQIFVALLPVLPPLIDALLAIVQAILPLLPVLTQLVQVITPVLVAITELTTFMINLSTGAIMPLIQALELFNTVVGAVMSATLSAFTTTFSLVSSAFTSLLGIVGTVLNGIKSVVGAGVDFVKNAISTGFNAAVGFARTALSNLGSAVSSGINTAVQFFAGLGGKVLSAIGNFGSLLFSAGADLLRGLVSGISSMIGHVIDSVVGVGKSILSGIKGALGISSPSKEMAKIGVFIGQGLIQGMEKITPAVNSAADKLGLGISSNVTGGLNIPGSGSGGTVGPAAANSSTMIQNNIMQPGTDIAQFANQVLNRANSDFLSGASSLGVQRQGVQLGVNDQFLSGVMM